MAALSPQGKGQIAPKEIEAIAPQHWTPYGEDAGAVKECAVVGYYPEEEPRNRYREPLRYIAKHTP